MGPFRVIVPNPGSDDTLGLGQGFKPVLPDTLFLQALDEPLHDAVLLRRVGGDELLGQTVASDGVRVAFAGEDQAVVASQDDRLRGSPEVPVAVDQCFFRSGFFRVRLLAGLIFSLFTLLYSNAPYRNTNHSVVITLEEIDQPSQACSSRTIWESRAPPPFVSHIVKG